MAVIMTESSVQSVVVFNDSRSEDMPLDDDGLVDELTDAMCAYLRVDRR